MFRESRLGNNEDPEICINNLEDLRIKLKAMGSSMTDDQFIVQVLNSLTSDCKLQMLSLEKQIGSKDKPLSIEDLKEELNLQFERLSMKQNDVLARKMSTHFAIQRQMHTMTSNASRTLSSNGKIVSRVINRHIYQHFCCEFLNGRI
jgi:gag-polypeptide of LTR copia-type